MFLPEDTKIKWYSGTNAHEVSVSHNDTDINLTDLYKETLKLVKEKDELCKKIYYLGFALTGTDYGAVGFLMGWLLRSIKKDKNWEINHTEETVTKEEVMGYMAEQYIQIGKAIKEHINDPDAPAVNPVSPTLGTLNGTELFK